VLLLLLRRRLLLRLRLLLLVLLALLWRRPQGMLRLLAPSVLLVLLVLERRLRQAW